jgi:hypothetical protein
MKTDKDILPMPHFFSTGAFGTGSCTTSSLYNLPVFIEANEVGESVEFLYKEEPLYSYTTFPPQYPPAKVFKIVYSCVDGKWNKSDRIYGSIVAASGETYEFD